MMHASLQYYAPHEVSEAVRLLAEASAAGRVAKILAGGTALVPQIREGLSSPAQLISLKNIPDLRRISLDGDRLRIGALVTIGQLARSALIQEHAPVLAQAAALIGGVQVRNMATVGGNLCNAAPYADLAAPFLILDGIVQTRSPSGRRSIPIDAFFRGPEQTALGRDEIALYVTFSRRLASRPARYHKLTLRRAMGIGIVNLGLALAEQEGLCEDVRIALSAVGPIPIRAREAEAALRGRSLSEETISAAARLAGEACRPADDLRASAWYRRRMVPLLVERGLRELRSASREAPKTS